MDRDEGACRRAVPFSMCCILPTGPSRADRIGLYDAVPVQMGKPAAMSAVVWP